MRIIELLIEELEDFSGFTEVALVKDPAIELPFYAFKENRVEDAIAFQILKHMTFDSMLQDGKPLFDTIEEAEKAAKELGCEGYHEHEVDGRVWYMPCKEHSDLTDDLLENYEFESFNDYPESSVNAAKRALEWRDSHPENDCGTRVGWARANQLANRRPISEGTIARMASFARHLQYEDVPYSEGCGGLMVDAWGARAGIEWAQRKLEEIEQGLSQEFSYFDKLPSTVQEKLIEKLSETGITTESLIEEGYTIEDVEESPNLTFALPTKSSANPDKPTNETTGDFKILYKYSGPTDSKNRTFCKTLLGLDLLFRKEDIDKMTIKGDNSQEFGYYNIFNYKGSFGCRHTWNKKRVYMKKDRNPSNIKTLTPADITKVPSVNVGVASIGDEDVTAFKMHKFAMDEDKKIVVGPLMVPDRLIFRVDQNDEPYYVFFSKETVKQISQKMMKEKLLDKMNLEHDQGSPIEGHMIETWIVEDEMNDKSNAYGMSLPEGSWVGAYQIEDDKIWNLVKENVVTGFSLEGFFQNKPTQ